MMVMLPGLSSRALSATAAARSRVSMAGRTVEVDAFELVKGEAPAISFPEDVGEPSGVAPLDVLDVEVSQVGIAQVLQVVAKSVG